jgi:large repetitive protein
VKKTSGTGTPTGNVTFKTGTTVLAVVALNGSGVAVLSASSSGYPNGTYPIVASYSGDTNDLASSSSTVNVVIATKTTTTLTASPNPVPHGGTVTLTATVTPTTAAGNVAFKTGTTTLATVALSGGKAILTAPTSAYPAGTYPVVATYAGNSSDAGSTSNTVNVVLQ